MNFEAPRHRRCQHGKLTVAADIESMAGHRLAISEGGYGAVPVHMPRFANLAAEAMEKRPGNR